MKKRIDSVEVPYDSVASFVSTMGQSSNRETSAFKWPTKSINFQWPIAQIIYQHHCRLDDSGYPNHLKGDSIILEARILAVADTVEAMSHNRPYRVALGIDGALKEVENGKGTLYDPIVVDACLKLFRVDGYQFPA